MGSLGAEERWRSEATSRGLGGLTRSLWDYHAALQVYGVVSICLTINFSIFYRNAI